MKRKDMLNKVVSDWDASPEMAMKNALSWMKEQNQKIKDLKTTQGKGEDTQ